MLPEKYKILYVGPDDLGTSSQRVRALLDLGHEIERVYTREKYEKCNKLNKILKSVRRRIGYPCENCNENSALLRKTAKFKPDIVLCRMHVNFEMGTKPT